MRPGSQATAVRAILVRELRRRSADPAFVLLVFVAPVAMALLLGHVVPPRSDIFSARYVLADDDRGGPALSVLRGPIRSLFLTEVVRIARVATEGEVRVAVEEGFADAGLYIPAGFSTAAAQGRPIPVRVLGSRAAALETLVLASALEGFGSGFEALSLAADLLLVPATSGAPPAPAFDPGAIESLGLELAGQPPPIVLRESTSADRMAEPRVRHGASMASIAVFVAAFLGVSGVLADMRGGTLARVVAAGVGRGTLALAALLGGLLFGLLSMAVTSATTWLLLGHPWGDALAVAALGLALALLATGVALSIITCLPDIGRASLLAGLVVLGLALLGGALAPSADAPVQLASLRHVSPHAWFLRGVGDLAAGAPWVAALPSLLVLLGGAAATTCLGLWCARRGLGTWA